MRIDSVDMSNVAPEKRPVNTVFQSYALFPHLSVADNVGFGLRFQSLEGRDQAAGRRGVGSGATQQLRQAQAHQLSGGQQQRVALARALVLRPKVLLLDEPLGALDAKLRKTLQVELRALHRDVGITFVYVTHDQEEALTMSDRLAVMNEGEIEQIGTPKETYEQPASAYVADFLGVANLLPARYVTPGHMRGGRDHRSRSTTPRRPRTAARSGCSSDPSACASCADGSGGPNTLPATVEHVVYAGVDHPGAAAARRRIEPPGHAGQRR